jgi:hypothetical protein
MQRKRSKARRLMKMGTFGVEHANNNLIYRRGGGGEKGL